VTDASVAEVVTVVEEFHQVVLQAAKDTGDLFKDDKYVRKLLKNGKYKKVAEYVLVTREMQPDFDFTDILEAADKRKGLRELVVDAAYVDLVWNIAIDWTNIMSAKMVMPSLPWPKGIKVGK
jgi:hypothetical protein